MYSDGGGVGTGRFDYHLICSSQSHVCTLPNIMYTSQLLCGCTVECVVCVQFHVAK